MSEEDKMEELEETAAADEEDDNVDEEDEFAGGKSLFNIVTDAGCLEGNWDDLTVEAKQKWQTAADNI